MLHPMGESGQSLLEKIILSIGKYNRILNPGAMNCGFRYDNLTISRLRLDHNILGAVEFQKFRSNCRYCYIIFKWERSHSEIKSLVCLKANVR